jgi:hypothetical protein
MSWRLNLKNIHNVIQLRNLPTSPSTFQLFTLDTSREYVSCNLSFDLDLLFKVTQVRFCKYSQCDTTPQSLGISIRFSSWMHLKRIRLIATWVFTLTHFSFWLHLPISHVSSIAPTMSVDSWIVCGWVVSLAQAFLCCKTFSSDVAEYRICKATFYSTQQDLYADWRKNAQAEGQHLPENHKVKQCKTSFTIINIFMSVLTKSTLSPYPESEGKCGISD